MTETLSAAPSLSSSISKIIESISIVSDSLFSLLHTGFDQVAHFGKTVMSSFVSSSNGSYTDLVIQSLVKLKLHLYDMINALEQNTTSFSLSQIQTLLSEKEQLLAHAMNNNLFKRTYGRYVESSITPQLQKIKTMTVS